jgi:acyl-CoA thioester hydrolase
MFEIGELALQVPEAAIDVNGHVNNVAYIQWMQDAAMYHSAQLGWPQERYTEHGWTWIIRRHGIEYLAPAYAGDAIVVQTWVADFHRIRSLRGFCFVRPVDDTVLARAETLFVFCDLKSGRPLPIPELVRSCSPVLASDQAP